MKEMDSPVCSICGKPNGECWDIGETILPDGRRCHSDCAHKEMAGRMYFMEYRPAFITGFDRHIKVVESWEDFARRFPPEKGWHYMTRRDSHVIFTEKDVPGEDGNYETWGRWIMCNAPPSPYNNDCLQDEVDLKREIERRREETKTVLSVGDRDIKVLFQVDDGIRQIKIVTPEEEYNATFEVKGDDLEKIEGWLVG